MDFNKFDADILNATQNKFAVANLEKAKTKTDVRRLAIKDKTHFTVNSTPVLDAEGKPTPTVTGLFVGYNTNMSKQYFNDGKLECYSNNGVSPASSCGNPQSQYCKGCVKQMYGSGTAFGKKAKACTEVRKVAVLLHNEQTKTWDADVTYLNLTATSNSDLDTTKKYASKEWFGFEQYLEHLESNRPGTPPQSYVVEINVCTDAEYNMMKFKPIRFVNTEELELLTKASDKPIVGKILGTSETPVSDVHITNMPNKAPVVINTDLTKTEELELDAALDDLGI